MRILLLGATGSIGQQTLKIIKKLKYELVGISFFKNDVLATKIKTNYIYSPINKKLSNVKNYDELIKKSQPDLIVNAIVGFAGLEATLIALNNKIDIALANKESLVVAGQFIMKQARQNRIHIFPIDSEHTSLYQIIKQIDRKPQQLIITASGGPFYSANVDELKKVSYAQAIHHPKWKMGAKISIDSATLVNKCFEIIEAFWYFNTKNITALYHPQTQIHAIVDYGNDAYAFISKPSMLLPIEQALTKFEKNSSHVRHFFNTKHKYTLEKINQLRWKPIAWAYKILKNPNSSLPIIINAANEQAIQMFKSNKIRFDQIIDVITWSINKNKPQRIKTVNDIYKIDRIIRQQIIQSWK